MSSEKCVVKQKSKKKKKKSVVIVPTLPTLKSFSILISVWVRGFRLPADKADSGSWLCAPLTEQLRTHQFKHASF